MSIFSYLDYREAIKNLVESRKKLDRTWTYQRVAQVMRIQKSYLSQVLNGGKVEISGDQLFLFTQHIQLPADETEYLFLLLEYSRSSLEERKRELKNQIELVRKKKLTSEAYLNVQEIEGASSSVIDYYLDSYNQLVHVCLSNDRFRKDPAAMSAHLGLQKERLQEILVELQRLGLIAVEKDEIKVLKQNVHLPKKAKVFRSWKTQMRQMALQRSLQTKAEETYNFSVLFSCTEKTRQKLQEKFFEFIQEAQKQVNGDKAERVYQMNFDLLSWL